MATTIFADPRSAVHETREHVFGTPQPRPSDKYRRWQNVLQNVPILGAFVPRSKPEPFERLNPYDIANHPDPAVQERWNSLSQAQRAQMVLARPSEYYKADRGERRAMLGLAPVSTADAETEQLTRVDPGFEQSRLERMKAEAEAKRAGLKGEAYEVPYYDKRGNLIQRDANTGKVDVLLKSGSEGARWGDPYETESGDWVQKNESSGKITVLKKSAADKGVWSPEFRNEAGDLVQRNEDSNEIRVVSRKANEGADYSEPFEDEQGNTVQVNKNTNKREVITKAAKDPGRWSEPARDETGAWVIVNDKTNDRRVLAASKDEWGPVETDQDGNRTQRNKITGKVDMLRSGPAHAQVRSEPFMDAKGNYVQINTATNKREILLKAGELGAGKGKPASFPDISSARGQFNQLSKEFILKRDAYLNILAATQDPTAVGDFTLIFQYFHLIDPTSTVREGEFANLAATGALGDRWVGFGKKLISGERFADPVRQDLVNNANAIFEGQMKSQADLEKQYGVVADSMGVPREQIIIDHMGDFRSQLSAEETSRMATQEDVDRVAKELDTQDPALISAELEKQGYGIP